MNKVKISIKSFWGSLLFESERDNVKEALQDAVLRGADLRGADLQDAVLRGAVLRGAVLRGADLRGADLRGAVLQDADLRGAVLRGADLRGADLRGAVLQDADLRGAVLQDADLRGAVLRGADLRGAKGIPKAYINLCSRDLLYVFEHTKAELPFLKEKLIKGEINGTQYKGECCCLVGSLSKAKNEEDITKYCSSIPYYEASLSNPAEQWFFQIRQGDTPENSEFAKHAVMLIDQVLNTK